MSWSVHIPPKKTLKMRTWKLVKSITFHSTIVLSTRLSFLRHSCLSNILSILPLKYSQRLFASFRASFPILDWLYINGFLQKSSETGSYLHAHTTLVTYKYKNLEKLNFFPIRNFYHFSGRSRATNFQFIIRCFF